MPHYLTTKEAAERLGITDRSIRRRVSSLRAALKEYTLRQGNSILIDSRLVEGDFKAIKEVNEVSPPNDTKPSDDLSTEIERLKKQIRELDKELNDLQEQKPNEDFIRILEGQLQAQNKQLSDLNQRIQEQNIIIARYQDQLQQLEQPQSEQKQEAPTDQPQKKEPSTENPSTAQSVIFILSVLLVLVVLALSFVLIS